RHHCQEQKRRDEEEVGRLDRDLAHGWPPAVGASPARGLGSAVAGVGGAESSAAASSPGSGAAEPSAAASSPGSGAAESSAAASPGGGCPIRCAGPSGSASLPL